MNTFISGWYVGYTRPRHEKKVATRLSELEIQYLLPTVKKLRTWNDRKKYIDTPLFPSYIFIYLKVRQDYVIGMEADGLLNFVRTGNEIARVKDTVIEDIKLIVEKGKDIEMSTDYFKAGQRVLVRSGPLCGLACEVVDFNHQPMVLVRVNLLKRGLLVSMPFENLEKIDPQLQA